MTARRHIDVSERRARAAARHHLGSNGSAGNVDADVDAVVRDLVALHSSDPITPYLALRARTPGFRVADLEGALYRRRSLWRLHGMRRTLFIVPTDQAATVQAASSRDVARTERRKLEAWVAAALDRQEPRAWLQAVESKTLALLSDGVPRRTQEVSAQVEGLNLRLTVGSGKWTADVPLSSRLLFLLALEGHLARAEPAGSWLSSQYRWVDARTWFHGDLSDRGAAAPPEGRAQLAAAYLRSHGPATAEDVRWWTGWTAAATRAALAAAGAVEVGLDGDATGWVLPDDLEAPGERASGVALLPGLDPTLMGWKQRDWYLGPHAGRLFDRNGNAGPTIWIDGRVVGGWALRDGEVAIELLEDVGAEASARVAAEASALTEWFGGVTATPRFRTPLERELASGGGRAGS